MKGAVRGLSHMTACPGQIYDNHCGHWTEVQLQKVQLQSSCHVGVATRRGQLTRQ